MLHEFLSGRMQDAQIESVTELHRRLSLRPGFDAVYATVANWLSGHSRPEPRYVPDLMAELRLADEDRIKFYELPVLPFAQKRPSVRALRSKRTRIRKAS
jgi:hypothetical protein